MAAATKTITRKQARKVLKVVDCGLTKGLGVPEPGKMCVEAAVSFALGEVHGDNPSCVHAAVRAFKISLNDSAWSSDAARTKGMRRLAIAQLGSAEPGFDPQIFVKELVLAVVRRILPIALRAAAKMNPSHAEALEAESKKCEAAENISAAAYAADAASAAAYAARAARAARAADAARAAYAAYAADAAYAAAYAARAASAAADAAARDELLTIMAEAGVEALKLAGSPGCEFLDLCEVEVSA